MGQNEYFGILWPKQVLRQVINTAEVGAPTSLVYVICKYWTYVLLTVSALIQHASVMKTEASAYYTSFPPEYI